MNQPATPPLLELPLEALLQIPQSQLSEADLRSRALKLRELALSAHARRAEMNKTVSGEKEKPESDLSFIDGDEIVEE